MKVKWLLALTGELHGKPAPKVGGVVDLPDEEAQRYCSLGYAAPVVEDKVEKAVMPEPEKRGPGRPPGSKNKPKDEA